MGWRNEIEAAATQVRYAAIDARHVLRGRKSIDLRADVNVKGLWDFIGGLFDDKPKDEKVEFPITLNVRVIQDGSDEDDA